MTTTQKPEVTTGRSNGRIKSSRYKGQGNPYLGKPLEETPIHWRKRVEQKTLSVEESFEAIRDGFARFQQRTTPSKTTRCSFRRVAGNVVESNDSVARRELKRMIEGIEIGGAFLVLGHGGSLPCGAVSAKQSHVTAPLFEYPAILRLLERIPDEVVDYESPLAERANARHQATVLLDDHEFGRLLKERNITVVAGVCTDDKILFRAMNRKKSHGDGVWDIHDLIDHHPMLRTLRLQMAKALETASVEGRKLKKHFAHGLFVWDPEDLKGVNGQGRNELSIGGITCVDARLPPRTPGPRFIIRAHPGEVAGVTCAVNGNVEFTDGETASINYLLRHVSGIAPELGGNGHVIAFASNLETARRIKASILATNAVNGETQDGKTISIASFNGRSLIVRNDHLGLEINELYAPVVRIF